MDAYRQIILNRVQYEVRYKFDLIFRLLLSFIPTVITALVWGAVYRSNHDLSYEVFYSYNYMLKYIIFANVFFNIIKINNYAISNDIRSGDLNRYLLRPIRYVVHKLWSDFGGFLVNLLFMTIPLLAIAFIFRISLIQMISFLIMSILSFGIMFLIVIILSSLTFWFMEVSFLFATIGFVTSFLSGTLVPVSIMPDFIRFISNLLPFRFFGYEAAVYIITGEMRNLILLQQLAWICFLYLVSKILWRKGLIVYGAFGG